MTDGSISSPAYGSNGGLTGEALVRFCFTFVAALVLGTIFWQVGTKRENSIDLTMIIGAMYFYVLFVGINNCSIVQPANCSSRKNNLLSRKICWNVLGFTICLSTCQEKRLNDQHNCFTNNLEMAQNQNS
ncbi:hypothetical protein LWI28_019425 [Acer negundo]|uniref:ABC-2 type transporter transmembrane domain-containing protein n=1 Tax=Acer negundo TaxID=4023 RepID=A0AAD5IFA5_ACENE|nr:hypothetical protein LWI28_019425 [Acer negundo]